MVGWKPSVVTVGEKLGKTQSAYAWVLTLPAAILLSGSLYWLFTQIF
jgi:hypothetical protein